MMQPNPAATSGGRPRHPPAIQFYAVEITPLADGRVFVGVGATICETLDDDEIERVNMDVACARVDTIRAVLAGIHEAVATSGGSLFTELPVFFHTLLSQKINHQLP